MQSAMYSVDSFEADGVSRSPKLANIDNNNSLRATQGESVPVYISCTSKSSDPAVRVCGEKAPATIAGP
eukprot:6189146-Pleurochrysis_carterae.AAC.2